MRSTGKLNLAKRLSPLMILFVMTGCATVSTGLVPTNSYCAIAKPISYDSTADSADTVKQVEDHNSSWACICEGDCPKGE